MPCAQFLPLSRLWRDHFRTRVLPRRGHHFVRVVGAWERGNAGNTGCSYAQDLADALPQLPNLIHLNTPDLVCAIRAGRKRLLRVAEANELEPEFVQTRRLEFDEREEALVRLLHRAKSIMHPEVTPKDLLASFRGVSGANLRRLAFTSRADHSEPDDLALILKHFPNLELLKINLELFTRRGALNPIISAASAFKPSLAAPGPKLRELVLTASYDGAQFYFGDVSPSLAPLMHLAQPFAETLQVLTLDIFRDDDFNPYVDPDNSNLDDYVTDYTSLAFTSPFPLLRRLTLRGLTSAFSRLLRSIDATMLPALASSLFYISHAPAHTYHHDGVFVNFAEAASRIPGFEFGQSPRSFESTTDRLAEWARQRDADRGPSRFTFPRESTWPEPVLHPHSRVDPTALGERLRVTIEHLHKWYRRACDAQDPDALVQIREVLEGVDANRAVVEAWTAGGGTPNV